MPYRILIVDDEEDIREGLNDFVDWASLGYIVVARLEDGQEAISFIRSNPVDVILTDIKMTFVSGLKLAQYVHDQQYDIKMIVISGYKEFEFAQEAMKYNVSHYLLKPTRFDEINRVFRDVKLLLDKEKAEKKRTIDIQIRNEEMMSILQRQFFADIAAGTLQDREEIERRLQLIGLPFDPENSPCCLYYLKINHREPLSEANQDHDVRRIFRFIQHVYKHGQDGILYTPLRTVADKIQIVAFDVRGGREETALKEKIALQFETVKGRICATLGIDTVLEEMNFYSQFMEIIPVYKAADASGSAMISKLPATVDPSVDRFEPLVIQKAKTYIQTMYDKEISLDIVAKHVYLNPIYFSRLFKNQTGRNFTDYLTEVRMIRAMDYLRQPKYKVYEIGAIVGYKSTKYFFKLFKQYAGCTPNEYRNKMQIEECQ